MGSHLREEQKRQDNEVNLQSEISAQSPSGSRHGDQQPLTRLHHRAMNAIHLLLVTLKQQKDPRGSQLRSIINTHTHH